jgi:integrase
MTEVLIYSPDDLSKNWFVWYKDSQGKRIKKYGKINQETTKEDRLAAARALQIEIKQQLPTETPLTWLELAEDFMAKQRWRKKSLGTYQTAVKNFANFLAGAQPEATNTKAYFESRLLQKNPTTYNKDRQKLGRVLAGIGLKELMDGIPSTRENRQPARYFQKHQIKTLTKELESDPELFLFVKFIYYCFIRPRELRQLKVDNLLLDSNQILVPGAISKNEKSEYIAIPAAFRPDLEQFRNIPPEKVLFPVPENHMYNRHRKILRKLGFGRGYCLYSWKHTGAIQAVKNGIGVKELQIQLRHHSLDQVNEYLRQMGVWDLKNLEQNFPAI